MSGSSSPPSSSSGDPASLADLHWLLLSPPLLTDGRFSAPVQGFDARQQAEIAHWLQQLRQQPQALHRFLAERALPATPGAAPRRLPLGRYAERLLEFYLLHGPTHRLVAANLPLRHPPGSLPGLDHTTLGEIDFLLNSRDGQALHWELAVKFFLCTATGEEAGAADFIGPDRAETLPSKLHKLFERQLAHPAPPPWQNVAWQPQAYTRGWMFYRHDRPVARCALLAPDHLQGRWLPWRDLDALPAGDYLLLPRARWMAPAEATAAAPTLSRQALPDTVASLWSGAPPAGARRWPSAQLLARLQPGIDLRREADRWFVVPDGWPEA